MKNMAKKIKTLRQTLGIAQHELGKKIDVPQATISKWELGKQNPSAEHRQALAALAGVSYPEFSDMAPSSIATSTGRRVQVIGAVQAGEWVDEVEWPEEDRYEVPVPLPEEWAGVPVHGFDVRGDSMNRVFPDGAVVYVVPLAYSAGSPKNGDIVVAIRKGHDGSYERTLKEYVVEPDGGKWLWPRSYAPEHQGPISFTGGSKKTAEVVIAGVVIAGFVLTRSAMRRPAVK